MLVWWIRWGATSSQLTPPLESTTLQISSGRRYAREKERSPLPVLMERISAIPGRWHCISRFLGWNIRPELASSVCKTYPVSQLTLFVAVYKHAWICDRVYRHFMVISKIIRMFGSGMAEVCLVVEGFFPTQTSLSGYYSSWSKVWLCTVLVLVLGRTAGRREGKKGRAWESSIWDTAPMQVSE